MATTEAVRRVRRKRHGGASRGPYPAIPDFAEFGNQLHLYAQLKHEQGSKGVAAVLARAGHDMREALRRMKALPDDRALRAREPDVLSQIRAQRPPGPRRLWGHFDPTEHLRRVEGALLARAAGCTLGAIVECWSPQAMAQWADACGDAFPPRDYWSRAKDPDARRYNIGVCREYTRSGMNGVPVDDDLVYTQLGLLILEDFGPRFTTADVGEAWLKYLPLACTAEAVALRNLKNGIPVTRVGAVGNPFRQWIGADIRADPWGYLAPGWPEKAAELAYRDAFISHRRNGIYGEMYFAAAISAAFAVDDPIEAIRIGLTEIPRRCALAEDVRWALRVGPGIKDHRQARAAVDRRFAGMNGIHTNNNACLTIFGLMIGGKDLTRVIGQTVAMGLDNDCNAATAGSILGATLGKSGLPAHWHRPFRNVMHSYIRGHRRFTISGLVRRFGAQAARVWGVE
ncbi:MAG: ADP-ribosylglycohydrolase family protein [Planctomycetes bacterium]|nr:ADP-ribosylglycohydrolase family protein [Planctomycetota bacterium]